MNCEVGGRDAMLASEILKSEILKFEILKNK